MTPNIKIYLWFASLHAISVVTKFLIKFFELKLHLELITFLSRINHPLTFSDNPVCKIEFVSHKWLQNFDSLPEPSTKLASQATRWKFLILCENLDSLFSFPLKVRQTMKGLKMRLNLLCDPWCCIRGTTWKDFVYYSNY